MFFNNASFQRCRNESEPCMLASNQELQSSINTLLAAFEGLDNEDNTQKVV